MAIFVLIPGGWSGGWQWRDVANRLRRAGHEVFTPTLTGLGERVHLATPRTNLRLARLMRGQRCRLGGGRLALQADVGCRDGGRSAAIHGYHQINVGSLFSRRKGE